MALKILWTPQAETGLKNVVEYLKRDWSEKEILKLEENLRRLLKLIGKFPELCPKSPIRNQLLKGFVDKNNYIV